ncbi:MAG TPA: Gfo/Idh/MocA family oxidoreductase [Chloroflexota bacterium]|nr:Gfo/Idh/MocA family oxidoreductase [Chloroflexota bacterium]
MRPSCRPIRTWTRTWTAVYIAVPHDLHAPLTIQAAQAGKHVLCEKPIAATLADADRMIAACERADVFLSVAFDAQIMPAMQKVRDLIATGAIGEVIGTRIVALIDKHASYWSSGWTGRVTAAWRISKEKAGGGVLIMKCMHDVNTHGALRHRPGGNARLRRVLINLLDPPGAGLDRLGALVGKRAQHNERCHGASLLVEELCLDGPLLSRALHLSRMSAAMASAQRPWLSLSRMSAAMASAQRPWLSGACLLVWYYRCSCDHRAGGALPTDRRMGVAQDVGPQPGQQR